jgi:hypothetical protein
MKDGASGQSVGGAFYAADGAPVTPAYWTVTFGNDHCEKKGGVLQTFFILAPSFVARDCHLES